MDPITRLETTLVIMQLLAFVFGMLFERSLEKRRQINEED